MGTLFYRLVHHHTRLCCCLYTVVNTAILAANMSSLLVLCVLFSVIAASQAFFAMNPFMTMHMMRQMDMEMGGHGMFPLMMMGMMNPMASQGDFRSAAGY